MVGVPADPLDIIRINNDTRHALRRGLRARILSSKTLTFYLVSTFLYFPNNSPIFVTSFGDVDPPEMFTPEKEIPSNMAWSLSLDFFLHSILFN